MKTTKLFFGILILLSISLLSNVKAQQSNDNLAIIQLDSKGVNLQPKQLGDLTRLEMMKLNLYNIMDSYDIEHLLKKENINLEGCFGTMCVTEMGKKIKADKVLTGSIEILPNNTVVTLRMINISSGKIEKMQVDEYLKLNDKTQEFIAFSLKRMFNQPYDKDVFERLTKKYNYENLDNTPNSEILVASGPRMGAGAFFGEFGEILMNNKADGGYDVFPMMFQFGYQFEKQYLNEGNFQALFEFLPMVTGLDQGLFIPSFTFMNGFRNNKNGWEIAFGPTFSVGRYRDMYKHNGEWHLASDWETYDEDGNYNENTNAIIERPDSRGSLSLKTGFVFAVGKTFKSGKLNIPLNAFVIPNTHGVKAGVSFGFNARKN